MSSCSCLCRIGPLYLADAPACAELEADVFAAESPWSEQSFREEIAQPANHYIALRTTTDDSVASDSVAGGVSFESGQLVGFAGCGQRGISEDDAEYEILTIAVTPALQRHGWGRALLSAVLAGTEQGTVFLEVRTDNSRAINLYKSCGFEKIGIRRKYYQPSGADALVMRRLPLQRAA